MEYDIEVKYDSLCAAALTNIYTLTKEHNTISMKNFNWDNDEHKFIFCLILSCYGVLQEKIITIDDTIKHRNFLNKKYKGRFPKIEKTTSKMPYAFDVNELLEYMRKSACELCGDSFNFGEIYYKYYAEEN